MIVVKAHHAAAYSGELHRSAVAALAEQGITTYSFGSRDTAGPAILFFDQPEPGVLPAAAELSRDGRDRLLALWLGKGPLPRSLKWGLLNHGATDVVHFGGASDGEAVAARVRRWHEIESIIDSPLIAKNLVGQSRAWRNVLRELVEVGRYTDASLFITGETGTGKELAAKLIHTLDRRDTKGELIVLDCTTVVPTLSGSEFFGHERGAFTGASAAREGVFSLADGGTLFLDEIGELPAPIQAELLRAIQEGAYKPIGSNTWKQANFRLVCATNRELRAEQDRGTFRRDLYYRVACSHIELPPLRDRRTDILPLFRHFAEKCGRPDVELDETVQEYLLTRHYTGNVRELRRLAERMCCRHTGAGPITVGAIPPEDRPVGEHGEPWQDAGFRAAIERAVTLEVGLKAIRKAVEDAAVDFAVELESNSLQRAAVRLCITPRAIQMRMAGRRSALDSEPPIPDPEMCAEVPATESARGQRLAAIPGAGT